MAELGLLSTEIRWSPDVASDDALPEDSGEEPAGDPTEEVDEPVDGDEPVNDQPVDDEPAEEEPVEEDPTPEGLLHGRGLMSSEGATSSTGVRLDPRADAALNVTTAADIAALYVMLLNGEIISRAASDEMLALLETQQINDRLPALLPAGTVVAHKTGNLEGLVHDAGVIFAPAGPVVVVVLTEDLDYDAAVALIAAIGASAYEVRS
jgi:hypothetical protein